MTAADYRHENITTASGKTISVAGIQRQGRVNLDHIEVDRNGHETYTACDLDPHEARKVAGALLAAAECADAKLSLAARAGHVLQWSEVAEFCTRSRDVLDTIKVRDASAEEMAAVRLLLDAQEAVLGLLDAPE